MRWIGTVLVAIAFLVTLVAYGPALKAGFYFDDRPNIQEVKALHWEELSLENFVEVARSARLPKRFVANLSFAMNHVFGGLDPYGYHLVNICIHLLVGISLFLLIIVYSSATSSRPSQTEFGILVAAVVTFLFRVHPLNSQAVSYVVQRMTTLAALFGLLALCFYFIYRQPHSRGVKLWALTASIAFWVVGLACKENLLSLPIVIIAYEWCFHRGKWGKTLSMALANPKKRVVSISAVLIGIAVVAILAKFYASDASIRLLEQFPKRDFNGWERVLTQARVHVLYLSLLLWPHSSRLNIDHDIVVSRSLFDPPSTWIAVLFWLVVFSAVTLLAYKRPRLGFPAIAYFMLHMVESAPIGLELAFEHRMYLPSAMLALLVAVMVLDLSLTKQRILILTLLLLCGPLAMMTYNRNVIWSDEIAFHYDVVAKSPEKYRPQYNLGTLLATRGRYSEAVPVLGEAISISPKESEPHNQLGGVYMSLGEPGLAEEQLREAMRLKPDNLAAVFNLAVLLDQTNRSAEALPLYRIFLASAPTYLEHERGHTRVRILILEKTGVAR